MHHGIRSARISLCIVLSTQHTHTHTEVCYTFKLYNNAVYSRIAFKIKHVTRVLSFRNVQKSNPSFISAYKFMLSPCQLNTYPTQAFNVGGEQAPLALKLGGGPLAPCPPCSYSTVNEVQVRVSIGF